MILTTTFFLGEDLANSGIVSWQETVWYSAFKDGRTLNRFIRPNMSRTDFLLCGGVLAAVAALIGAAYWLTSDDTEFLLQQAETAFANADFHEAESIALSAWSRDKGSMRALVLAGQAAAARDDHEKALEYFERIPDDGSPFAKTARYLSGEILLMKLNRLSDSERLFRRAIRQDPDYVEAHDMLIHVLVVGGRYSEANTQILELVRLKNLQRFCSKIGIFILGSEAEKLFEIQPSAAMCHEADPDDPAPLIALAINANHDGNFAAAEQFLRQAVKLHPELMPAQVWLGRTLLNSRADAKFFQWNQALSAAADDHPEIWIIRAEMARLLRQPRVAVRCFGEAIRRNGNLIKANLGLGQVLRILDDTKNAELFLQRSNQLSMYLNALASAREQKQSRHLKDAVRLAKSLKLKWEAKTWELLTPYPEALNSSEEIQLPTWNVQWEGRSPQRLAAADNPVLRINLSDFPLPDWPLDTVTTSVPDAQDSEIRASFEDRAAAAGLIFQYNNSGRPKRHIKQMQEALGGSVSVLDFDADGWPDIYLSQGGDWPTEKHRGKDLDCLFQNLGNGKFREITADSGIVEDEFSHGVAVGDFNSDGFPDFFVCNAGANRLYQNNGDGTFSDETDAAGIRGIHWTPSALIADLNGDALPDICVVNYVTGDDVYTRLCESENGGLGSCGPSTFKPSQDQIYLNAGDGRFIEITGKSGIGDFVGNGLGIVAMALQGNGTLDLFIANDGSSNHFFTNQTRPGDSQLRFIEEGPLSGLSTNGNGIIEACMGIAVGDFNGDGTIDIFVGNFVDETNTLYGQFEPLSFIDVTREAGLGEVSKPITTFGAQFIDGDLDGDLDLMITNGHVNMTDGDVMFQMPGHYYRNLGNGVFAQDTAETLGPYFADLVLGRGMARLDWNRDGASDILVSHLDVPVSLLTNTTKERGNFITIQLRGVSSSRDAIGTTVTVEIGGKKLMRQLTGGDGYLASNQKLLTFGLGPATRADRLSIHWPSGAQQSWEEVAAGSQLLVIEHHDRLFQISD